MVSLTQRAIDAQLPDLAIIDMRQMQKEKQIRGVFSTPMLEAIQQTLMRGEQVILFQNRRGYSPYLICMHCGHVPECVNCDISLTYHKYKDYARCHYCGHTEYLQDKCPTCGNFTLKKQGVGTERIEEEIKEHFPSMVVERMDLDTTRGKLKFQRLIARLESKEINILVGTQMVSKGLDFENVTLVGVVNADNLLTYPDFRVYEYAYQMLTQVSGRAGRSTKKGKVLIQTLQPQNQVLTALNGSYAEFYEATIKPREELQYPPFARLLRIEIHHPEQQYIEAEALRLNALFKPIFGDNLLGPDYTSVPRIRNLYRMQFLLKIHKT
jgi:primosomal protein N' (replication factor Y)